MLWPLSFLFVFLAGSACSDGDTAISTDTDTSSAEVDETSDTSDPPDTLDTIDTPDTNDLDTTLTDTTLTDTTLTDTSIIDILDSQDSDAADDTSTLDIADIVPQPDTTPVSADAGVWTWFDEPGTSCNDGTETGFAINPSPTGSNDTLVFFMGGGACWDQLTCYVINSAVKGPFQAPQFEVGKVALTGVFDRDDGDNAFADWNFAFIPYCTGDLHGGQRLVTYGQPPFSATWNFAGATNSRLILDRLAATFFQPTRLVISGTSAGGYGASLNYERARKAFRPDVSYLLMDSSPFLIGNAINPNLRSAWFSQWDLQPILDEVGCTDCAADLSRLYSRLSTLHPDDRMGLVSSLQDGVISTYFTMLGPVFELELRRLAMNVYANNSNWRWFLFPGTTHTTVATPGLYSSGGTSLKTWFSQMVSAGAWQSHAP